MCKYLRNATQMFTWGKRHGFSNRSSVELYVSWRKQKHFIWPSESRCIYESLRLLTTKQHNPNIITMHFMNERFVNLGEEVILTLLFLVQEFCALCVCVRACVRACVWVCVYARVCERGRHGHTPLLVYCKYIKASSLSVTLLGSPFRLELMV